MIWTGPPPLRNMMPGDDPAAYAEELRLHMLEVERSFDRHMRFLIAGQIVTGIAGLLTVLALVAIATFAVT